VNDVTWIEGSTRVKKLRSQEDMANHLGTAVFARILLWGFGLYISRDTRYVPMEYQKSLENGKQKQEGMIALTNDRALPSIKSIQQMLKSSITRLSVPMFTLFQSILVDFWALQSFVEPYRYEERLPQSIPLIIGSTNDVAQSDKKEMSAQRKQIESDMHLFKNSHKKLLGSSTPNQSSADKDNKDQISMSSSSSSSCTSSSSSLSRGHMSINLMSPSEIKTPHEVSAKTKTRVNENPELTEATGTEPKKRKQEIKTFKPSVAENAVENKQQGNNRTRLQRSSQNNV
jgi:hypothetical protein